MPGLDYEMKFCSYPSPEMLEVLKYFNITLKDYDEWQRWHRLSGHDIGASGLEREIFHMSICDCYLKENQRFLNLDKNTQLMVFMCVKASCSCYAENKLPDYDD